MSQHEDDNKEGQSPSTKPQFDFNHSVSLNENENKFMITSIEKISKDEFRGIFDVDYLKMYDFPSNKTQHIKSFLTTALVSKNSNKIKLHYGFISRKDIRLKMTKNKAFTLDEKMKLKNNYEARNKDLLIIGIEFSNEFMSDKWYLPLEYLRSGNKLVNIEGELQELRDDNQKLRQEKEELRQEFERKLKLLKKEISKDSTPRGMISMWSGRINEIPNGWVLCNGQNGTPNLKDRFIVSYGDTFNSIGNKGGSKQHNHKVVVGNHSLTVEEVPGFKMDEEENYKNDNMQKITLQPRDPIQVIRCGGKLQSQSHNHAGSSSKTSHLPPYYTLAFVMKT